MFDGDNDGFGAMLPWVCVLGGLQRKIETVKMKKNKLAMLKMNEKKMKSLGQRKIKSTKRG